MNAININGIPEELKKYPFWCVWKNDTASGKVPYNPHTGYKGDSSDTAKFSDFETSKKVLTDDRYDGLGIGVFETFGIIDIDNCYENGELNSEAKAIIEHLGSYAETSPSGNGVHIIFKTRDFFYDKEKYYINKKGLECYIPGATKKYVTVTGHRINDKPIVDVTETLPYILETYMRRRPPTAPQRLQEAFSMKDIPQTRSAEELLRIGMKKDPYLANYWEGIFQTEDESVKDAKLLNKLLYWLNRDVGATIQAFMESPYVAQKDADHKAKLQREDYIQRTMNAIMPETTAEKDHAKYLMERNIGDIQSDLSQLGVARCFAKTYADTLCFNSSWGWTAWDSKIWIPSDESAATRAYMTLADIYKEIALDVKRKTMETGSGTEQADQLLKFATNMRKYNFMDGCLKMASALMEKEVADFDANPYDLNTPDGIIDLRNGKIRPHDSKAYCTKITKYGPTEKQGAKWLEFLDWVTCGDQSLADYIQFLAGMICVGRVTQENMIIAHGSGANGKSTLFNAIQQILGDYAGSLAPEILMSHAHHSQEMNALASVFGLRLVVASESEEGQRLSSSMIKRLASTDAIQAKRLYHEPFTFKPSHTLVFYTNHLPRIGSTDHGTWRRINVIPFNAVVAPDQEVKNLADELCATEGGAIMAWVIEGAKRFIANGNALPTAPQAVIDATIQYRDQNDWLKEYFEERIEEGPTLPIPAGALYQNYKEWAQGRGEFVRRASDFSAALENAGYVKRKERNGMFWHGLCLRFKGSFGAQKEMR